MREEVADLLREGLALIEDEAHWTVDVYQYRHFDGNGGMATAYCSIGALRQATGLFGQDLMIMTGEEYADYEAAVIRLGNAMRPEYAEDTHNIDYAHSRVVSFNDNHVHAEVVGAFKRAIIDEETS